MCLFPESTPRSNQNKLKKGHSFFLRATLRIQHKHNSVFDSHSDIVLPELTPIIKTRDSCRIQALVYTLANTSTLNVIRSQRRLDYHTASICTKHILLLFMKSINSFQLEASCFVQLSDKRCITPKFHKMCSFRYTIKEMIKDLKTYV